MNKDNNSNKENKNQDTQNQQQADRVSPYGRGKDLNPTQNPDLKPDEFTKSMKDQDRADNVGGRAEKKNPSGSQGIQNDK